MMRRQLNNDDALSINPSKTRQAVDKRKNNLETFNSSVDYDLECAIAASLKDDRQTQRTAKVQSLLKTQYNKCLVSIDGFGDCQFMALSHQLYGSPDRHLAIRTECCDYIQQHPSLFYNDAKTDNTTLEQYLRCMRLPASAIGSSYGDDLTLAAFHLLHKRPVVQYRLNQSQQSIQRTAIFLGLSDAMIADPRTVHLLYDAEKEHYDSVVDIIQHSFNDLQTPHLLYDSESECYDDISESFQGCQSIRSPTEVSPTPGPWNSRATALEVDDVADRPTANNEYIQECISKIKGDNYKHMLNDGSIGLYVEHLLASINRDRASPPSLFILPQPFRTQKGAELMLKGLFKTWSKTKYDPKSAEKLLAVAFQHRHFWAYQIDLRTGQILLYDSLSHTDRHSVESGMLQRALSKFFPLITFSGPAVQKSSQQRNGYDCGVFVCEVLRRIVCGENITGFNQADIRQIRENIEQIFLSLLEPPPSPSASPAEDGSVRRPIVSGQVVLDNPAKESSADIQNSAAIGEVIQLETPLEPQDIFTPDEVIDAFISLIHSTRSSTVASRDRLLILPTNAHMYLDMSFERWANQLAASIDTVERFLFPAHSDDNQTVLIDIEVRPCCNITVTQFGNFTLRPLACDKYCQQVRDILSKEYSQAFQFMSKNDVVPFSATSLSSGTLFCASIIRLLTGSSQVVDLSQTASMIQRSLHLGRIDELMPSTLRTGMHADPLVAHRQAMIRDRANFDSACNNFSNETRYSQCVKALRQMNLEPYPTHIGAHSLARVLTAQLFDDESCHATVSQECGTLLDTANLEHNSSNYIQQFCVKYDCRVVLYELLNTALAERVFLPSVRCNHGSEPKVIRILHGYADQYFGLRPCSNRTWAEVTAEPVPQLPHTPISIDCLRKRPDNRRAEVRRHMYQMDRFISKRTEAHSEQTEALSDDLVKLEDFTVSLQNVNSYTNTPVGPQALAQFIDEYKSDITIIVDARATDANATMYEGSIRRQLPGSHVSVFPTSVETKRTLHDDVGSIIITVSPRLRSHVRKTYRDSLGLGVVGAVRIDTPSMKILVIGTYWMTRPSSKETEDRNSLWMRTKRKLQQAKLNLSPLQYVKSSSEELLLRAKMKGWRVIYAGDLNSGYKQDVGQHHDCEPWSSRFGLRNLPFEYVDKRKLAPIITRFNRDGTGRAIDHILTDFSPDFSCSVNPRLRPTLAETLSDHLPLVVTFRGARPLSVKAPYTPISPRPIELDRKNKVNVEAYVGTVTEFDKNFITPYPDDNGLAARHYIESLCEIAVEEVTHLIGAQDLKARKINYFNGWSPIYMLHCYQLSFLYRLRKLVEMAADTSHRIPGYDVRKSIQRICDNLTRARDRLNQKSPPDRRTSPLELLLSDAKGHQYTHEDWLSMDLESIVPTILAVIPALKKRMHARKRAQDRELISAFVKKNEQRRKERKFKQLFAAIFNRYRRDIDQIVNEDGTITADPIEIHDAITDHLTGWHRLNYADRSIEWQKALRDPEYLLSIPGLQHVPKPLLGKLAKSFTRHSKNAELTSTMKAALNDEVSFEEYMNEVRSKANNKSPGLSGFSINMLKEFPEEVQRHLHDALCQIWKRRSDPTMIPESWFARWLCTVPKKKNGPITLDAIRPISLYEVLRKIWTSIITARISKVWTSLKVLHPTQYGYQFSMGTDTELIQVINVVEDAAEFKKRLILTSFDTTKAFDSVNKPLMVAAWERLGVPPDIADYLVNIDVGGDTLIKTPHAKSVMAQLKKGQHLRDVKVSDEKIKSTAKTVRTFEARDGIGQGDSPSANAWIAIYDILLCALDEIEEEPYRFLKRDGEVSSCTAAAYADDLQTFSPTVAHAQAAIEIVSAFNCVTGFTTNVKKMHCGTNLSGDFGTVQVYDKSWQAHPLRIEPEMEVEILGVTVDLTNRWRTLRTEIDAKIAEISLPLTRKRLSVETKRIAFEMVVLPTLLYKAKFINLSLREYESLLNPVNALLRNTNLLKRSTPEETLYSNHKTAAGLQLPRVVSRIQDFKIGMFTRAMQTGNPANSAAVAIIERCFRQQAISTPGNANISISDFNCSWYSSILEWQSGLGTRLYRNTGSAINYASHQPIRELCNPKYIDECDTLLAQLDISIVRDLTAETRGQPFRRWFTDHPVVRMLSSFPSIPNSEPNILQIGKLYLSRSSEIHEFCGWEGDTLYFREWKPRRNKTPAVDDMISLVADPQQWDKRNEEFCLDLCAHVYAYGKTNKRGEVVSTKIWAIQPDSYPVKCQTIQTPPIPPPSKSASQYKLFTDGAHRLLLSPKQIVFGILPCDQTKVKVQNSSGGVIYKNSVPFQTLTVTGFDDQTIPNSSPFEPEAVGLLAGLTTLGVNATNAVAYTDSKTLIGKLGQYRRKVSEEYVADHLIARLHQLITQYNVTLIWVKGHPERRPKLKRINWNSNDIGIYIADQMTRGEVCDPLPLRLGCDNIQPTVINFRELLPAIISSSRYQYRRADSVPLAEYQMRELHKQSIGVEYLEQREVASRDQRNIPWTQLSIPLAVQAIEHERKISKSRIIKTVYDKYDDDLYKKAEKIQNCPLCREEKDTTEHLYHCCHADAVAMVQVANIQQQRIPPPPELYECDEIGAAEITHLKDTIIRVINTDARTRIGMFNQLQQDEILSTLPMINKRDDTAILLGVISRFIVQLLQPSTSATLALIDLRNKQKKALGEVDQPRETAKKKTRRQESHNPYTLLFPEEPEYVEPDPLLDYEICYGSPSVITHIVARSHEEALLAISRLTQIPPSQIDIYHSSNELLDSYELVSNMSTQRVNFIINTTSIFSPLLSFSEALGGELKVYNRFRVICKSSHRDRMDYQLANLVVRMECLILTERMNYFHDFLQRCHTHASDADDAIILRSIHAVQSSALGSRKISCENLHAFLAWSPLVSDLRQIIKYAISFNIPSGFTRDQMSGLGLDLLPDTHLPQIIDRHGREIAIYQRNDPRRPRMAPIRKCKQAEPLMPKSTEVRISMKDCLSFHDDESVTIKVSTFPTSAPPPRRSDHEDLLDVQNNVHAFSLKYETICHLAPEDCDQNVCHQIISDSESLLTDEKILKLSVSHRKFLREKLRKAIIQVRTILQEAVAYDPSQLLNTATKTKSIQCFFNRRQPDSTVSRHSLDNKEHPD